MLRFAVGYILFAVMLSSVACVAEASAVGLKVEDKTGAAFPDVLVIVKSLSLEEKREVEIFRALTDANGAVPSRELPAGLYRLIATCPYGICKTKVQEFYVRDNPVQLDLTLDVVGSGTHGEGDVIEVGPSTQLKVQVTDSEGRPARLAWVIVRDSDVQHEGWYKTDSSGSAIVKLPEGAVTVVVLYEGNLAAKTLSAATIDELRTKSTPLTIRLGAGQDASISTPFAPQDGLAHESNHVLVVPHKKSIVVPRKNFDLL